jgi:hypothetical protein
MRAAWIETLKALSWNSKQLPFLKNCKIGLGAGLPDGKIPNIAILKYFGALGMKNVGKSYVHFYHFTVTWFILWPFRRKYYKNHCP